MWCLECFNGTIYYLWEKQKYSVGRKCADIIISQDDSVSRNHAVIELDSNESIYLTDIGSTYGTFHAKSKLNIKEKCKLNNGDEIKFGLLKSDQSRFKVKKIKFVISTSNLKSSDKKQLNIALDFLKATKSSNWNKNCTHLVVSEVILTTKVLCALTEGQAIVNIKYFEDYINAIKTKTTLPDPKNYTPDLNETLINKNIKLEFHPNRKILFQKKIFVFFSEKCKLQMAELISITGGTAISWEKNKFDMIKLNKKHNYIFIEENMDEIDKNTEWYKSFIKCVNILKENGKRTIPIQEIALAIIHNSCEENCNPSFNRVALLLLGKSQETPQSENVLVCNTEDVSTSSLSQSQASSTQNNQEVLSSCSALSIVQENSKRILETESETERETERPSKRNKKAETDESPLFTFKRRLSGSESSQSTNISEDNPFKFAIPTTSLTKSKVDKNILAPACDEENPFTRKRKPTTDLAPPAKKNPLANISNITNSSKTIETSVNYSDNNSIKINSISFQKNVTWMSKTDIIKKENIEDEMKIKLEEMENEKIDELNEVFMNSFKIEFAELVVKREIVSNGKNENTSHNTKKNVKTFKKNPKTVIQTTIITEDKMSRIVVGQEHRDPSDDELEEQNDDNDDDMQIKVRSAPKIITNKRRKFEFNI